MRLLEHTLQTTARPEQVWETLLQFETWHTWNVLSADAPNGAIVGSPLRLVIHLDSGWKIPARCRFVDVEPQRRLIWTGGPPGLFRAVHGFTLTPTPDGGCSIRHHESFRGLLVPALLGVHGRDPVQRYSTVNTNLARAAVREPSPRS